MVTKNDDNQVKQVKGLTNVGNNKLVKGRKQNALRASLTSGPNLQLDFFKSQNNESGSTATCSKNHFFHSDI
jgi:hypothetical protein